MGGFVVSGIGPSDSGVGRMMKRLSVVAFERGYKLICRRQGASLRGYLQQGKVMHAVSEVSARIRGVLAFNLAVGRIRESNVVAVHPQTLGYKNLFRMIENGNSVSLYVMDNSYFCVRSYNHLPGEAGPCFKCLGGRFDSAARCTPFPANYSREENTHFLEKLMDFRQKIRFVVQNSNQGELLKHHFGGISYRVAGLLTDEMLDLPELYPHTSGYDVVYHAAAIEPKGILYLLQLARLLPDCKILVPARASDIMDLCSKYGIDITKCTNLAIVDMTWEGGLVSIIRQAKMVICPSLWSAPIEGALIKSIMWNGKVAVVDVDFSFVQELPDEVVLKLPTNVEYAASLVQIFLSNPTARMEMATNARAWATTYLSRAGAMSDTIFE